LRKHWRLCNWRELRREAAWADHVILPRMRSAVSAEGMTQVHAVSDQTQPTIVISGSLAFDQIMTYPGSFQDHIIPGKVHLLSVSFLFDSLRRHRGGVAGNIAYNFALLGERPALVGAGGSDFGEYRAACENLGIDTSHVVEVENELTGSSFMTTDLAGNQIAGFYPGASSRAEHISVSDLANDAVFGIVGPTTLAAMRRHAREFGESPCHMVYDASQQVVSLPEEDLREGIGYAWGVIGSDYELAVIEQKTGFTIENLANLLPFLGVTFGSHGSQLYFEDRHVVVPAVGAETVGDPTGGGDAYRAGVFKGIALGLPLEICGRLGSLTATYAVERHAPQEHSYTAEEFVARFERAFPEYVGALEVDWFNRPFDRDCAIERLERVAVRGD
jgi:adenosine kinase